MRANETGRGLRALVLGVALLAVSYVVWTRGGRYLIPLLGRPVSYVLALALQLAAVTVIGYGIVRTGTGLFRRPTRTDQTV